MTGAGSMLTVDLSADDGGRREVLPAAVRRRLGGGGTLGAALLLDRTRPGMDPFDPDALVVLCSGPATGIPAVGLPRCTVVAKSPLSGGAGESRLAGPLGPALRATGHDAVVVTGRADTTSYVLIEDGDARVVGAPALAGLDTAEVTDTLHQQYGSEASVLAVGPAGERLVRFATAVADHGFPAGAGVGAVLGAKNLKAVVVTGGHPPDLHDPALVAALTAAYEERIPANPLATRQRRPPGFGVWPGPGIEGYLGIENYRTAAAGDWSAFDEAAYLDRLTVPAGSCPGCPQDCIKRFRSGALGDRSGHLHQEAVAAFAANLGIRDLDAVLELNASCHRWGLCPVSLSFTLSALLDAAASGALDPELAREVPAFGDRAAIVDLCEATVERRGLGDLVAEGSARLARLLPAVAPFALHSKGVEVGSFDPRGSHGQALASAVSPIGPRYDLVEHDIDFDPEWGDPVFIRRAAAFGCPPEGFPMASLPDDKVRFVARLLELWSGCDALGVCLFAAPPTRALEPGEVAGLAAAVTGWSVDVQEVVVLGRLRLAALCAYTRREGVGADQDTLPLRFFERPVDAGRLRGSRLEAGRFEEARRLLYAELGWDPGTGYPHPDLVAEVALS